MTERLIKTRRTPSEKLDLEYHRRCEAVAKVLDRAVYGSTYNNGFTTTKQEDVPHVVVEFIEKHHFGRGK